MFERGVMKKICALTIVLVFVLALTGCNTVKGFGKDLKQLGEMIQNIGE